LWRFYRIRWIFFWLFFEFFVWNFFTIICGIFWNFFGIFLEFLWNFFGIFLEFFWNFFEIFLEFFGNYIWKTYGSFFLIVNSKTSGKQFFEKGILKINLWKICGNWHFYVKVFIFFCILVVISKQFPEQVLKILDLKISKIFHFSLHKKHNCCHSPLCLCVSWKRYIQKNKEENYKKKTEKCVKHSTVRTEKEKKSKINK